MFQPHALRQLRQSSYHRFWTWASSVYQLIKVLDLMCNKKSPGKKLLFVLGDSIEERDSQFGSGKESLPLSPCSVVSFLGFFLSRVYDNCWELSVGSDCGHGRLLYHSVACQKWGNPFFAVKTEYVGYSIVVSYDMLGHQLWVRFEYRLGQGLRNESDCASPY